MKVGFTGTRKGMSRTQASQLQYVLALLRHADQKVDRESEFHYGKHESIALLADAEAAHIAGRLGFELVPHSARRGTELARDRRQVEAVSLLIAAPETDREQQRSGTWATVRYAREAEKPVVMLSRGK